MYEGFTFEGADETFLKAARRIEDAVMFALNSGTKIVDANSRQEDDCRCPLGCINLNDYDRFPVGAVCAPLGIDWDEAYAFTCGFDGERRRYINRAAQFYRLGLAYRRRFVEGGR